MSKGHMIILGGLLDRHDDSDAIQPVDDDLAAITWPSVKRSHGAHRIATYLREEGYDVEVLDFWPSWTPMQILKFFHQRVREDTLCVGISAMFPLTGKFIANRNDGYGSMGKYKQSKAREMLQTVKRLKELYPQLRFVGGAHNLSALVDYDLDFYVAGYGEYAMAELMKYFKGEFNTLQIQNTLLQGRKIQTINCKESYPAFPMPNAAVKYEDRDYIQPQEVLTLELARGCKFKCKFCSFTILGVRGDYSRCGDSLREELEDNYNRWGVNNYSIADETINDSPEKLKKHADVVRNLPFDIRMSGFMRADLLVAKPDTWQDIWDLGLRSHYYGLETFNHAAGKYVGKGMNPDKLKEGLVKMQKWFKDKGEYACQVALIIGLPGETKESFFDGLQWTIDNLHVNTYSLSPLYIANGETLNMMTNPSEFEKTWREEGVIKEATNEEMGVDYNKLKQSGHYATKLDGDYYLKWSHDTMNLWEAMQIFDECKSDPELKKGRGPGIFYYHRYLTTNKYSMEDMFTKNYDTGIDPLSMDDIQIHLKFIDEYIEKKLSN